jgi:hypothetical protein
MLALGLGGADRDPGFLGQQVSPPACHLAQLRGSRRLLVLAQAAEASMPPGDSRYPGDEEPVGFGTGPSAARWCH